MVKYRHCDECMVLKITDDKVVRELYRHFTQPFLFNGWVRGYYVYLALCV